MQSTLPLPRMQSGFALIAVLLMVVAITLTSTLAVTRAQHDAQRDREKQLLWVGDQYRQALLRYRSVNAGKGPEFPAQLEELLDDRRLPSTTRHIRQLYADPMTGKQDWTLVKHGDRVVGVRSRSVASPIKISGFKIEDAGFAKAKRISDWQFLAAETAAGKAGSGVLAAPGAALAPGRAAESADEDVAGLSRTAPSRPQRLPVPVPAASNADRLKRCEQQRAGPLLACRTDNGARDPACEANVQREFQTCLLGN